MSAWRADQIARIKQTITAREDQQRTLHADLSPSLNQMYQLLAQLDVEHDAVGRC